MDTSAPYWTSQVDDKQVLHDASHPIDPSFGSESQPPHPEVAAAAAATSQPPARGQGPQDGGPGGQGPGASPTQDGIAELVNRQGRPLSQTKRAAQNRAAQRAFRQRKEIYIKDLEAKVAELKQSKETIDALRQEIIQLRDYILVLQSRLIEHPAGVPTPPAVYQRRPELHYDIEKKR